MNCTLLLLIFQVFHNISPISLELSAIRRLSSQPVGFDFPGIFILVKKIFKYIIFYILEIISIEIEFINIRSEFRIMIT
jgi:hypothetical protein